MTASELVRITLAWLGTYALHSTLFLGGAWALCALRTPRSLRNRERLWKLALVGGLATASIQLGLDARPLLGRIDWEAASSTAALAREGDEGIVLEQAPAVEAAPLAPALAVVPREAIPDRRGAGAELARPGALDLERDSSERASAQAPSLLAGQARPVRMHLGPKSADPAPRDEPAIAGPRTALLERLGDSLDSHAMADSWPGLVFLGWTAIGVLGLLGVALSWASLRRALLGRTELRDGPLVECLAELRRRNRVRGDVRLSVSPRLSSPFSTGILRPEICLPTAVLTDLTPGQQEALLAHELAHTMRRDPAWFGAFALIERLFFFQPLNRLARAELSELAELACDDHAVRWTGERLALASCLTEVAGWVLGERPRSVTLPGLAGRRSRLGRRVERLLDDRRSPSGEPREHWWVPTAAASLVLVTLAVPGISASSDRPPAEAPRGETRARPTAAKRTDAEAALPSQEIALPDLVEESRRLLEGELVLLQREIAELHAELERRQLREHFAVALAGIDERLSELLLQHERARALLELLPLDTRPPERP